MNATVSIVPTGVANIASVMAAWRRLSCDPVLVASAAEIAAADYLVLPGVGAFGPAMDRLHELKLVSALQERIAANRPTLAICLGLQLLGASSEESPGVTGLEVWPEGVTHFAGDLNVPHMGWNSVRAPAGCEILLDGAAYFANSFRLASVPAGWHGAQTEYGATFVSAVERGAVLACQFHPELSGDFGMQLLQRWLDKGAVAC